MPCHPEAEPESLRDIGIRAHAIFKEIQIYLAGTSQQESWEGIFMSAIQRFDLWSRNLGLYQRGHASLDYRFRDAPTTYSFGKRLLYDLEETLVICEHSTTGALP